MKKFRRFLLEKYELTFRNRTTYTTLFRKEISFLYVFIALFLQLLIISILSYFLIVKVPWVRNALPGLEYIDNRKQQEENARKISFLKKQIAEQDSLIALLQKTLDFSMSPEKKSQSEKLEKLFVSSQNTSSARIQEKLPKKINTLIHKSAPPHKGMFLLPVQGILIKKFDNNKGHFGTDFAAQEGTHVVSIAEGKVIFSEYSLETGHTIIVQHKNGFVSLYKHNLRLLKSAGEMVRQGEPIALVGGSGEYSTGPHLHFELWYRGIPMNPEWVWDFK